MTTATDTDTRTISDDMQTVHAAQLRARGFTVRPHGIKWLVLQDGQSRRLTLDPPDLALAARIAQATDDRLTTDELADRLYEVTGMPKPGTESPDPPGGWGYQSLLIKDIRRDGGTQARVGLNEETVQDYAELMREHRWDFGSRQRPIVLYDGSAFWLADGFHRIEAAQRAAMSDYPVEILRGTQRDAVLRACRANADHGLRRSNADKRQAVVLLLRDEEWRQWSDRKIADVCAVSDVFVGKVRRDLSANGLQMPETRMVERSGTTYQMTPAPKSRPPSAAQFHAAQKRANHLNLDLRMHDSGAFSLARIGTGEPAGGAVDWPALCDLLDRKELAASRPGGAINRPDGAPLEASSPEEPDQDQARIRALAEPLGLLMVWEDDKVQLYWPDEADDLEQMDLLSYGAALSWLEGEAPGIAAARTEARQAKATTTTDEARSSSAEYKAKEQADQDILGEAAVLIERGHYAYARQILERVHVATYERDKLLSAMPPLLSLDTQKRLIACGAAYLPSGEVLPPEGSGEPTVVMDEAAAEQALIRWPVMRFGFHVRALPDGCYAIHSAGNLETEHTAAELQDLTGFWSSYPKIPDDLASLGVVWRYRQDRMYQVLHGETIGQTGYTAEEALSNQRDAMQRAGLLLKTEPTTTLTILIDLQAREEGQPFPGLPTDLPALMKSISYLIEVTNRWGPGSQRKIAPALAVLREAGRKALEVSE